MSRLRKPLLTAIVGLTMALALAVPAGAHPDRQIGITDDGTVDNAKSAHGHQHGGIEGHLPPAQSNVELVGKAAVSDRAPGRVADVNVFGNYAYLAAFADPSCERGGVYVFDIADVTAPREVGFIPTGPGSFVGEGVQIVPLRTRAFRGDVLIFNNEICALAPGNVGGATLVDVSDPLNPQVLSAQFGDFDPPGVAPGVAHQVHSAFIWTHGRSAYAVLVDDEESRDVDIFDISDPRNPVKVAEYDLAAMFPQILQPGLEEVFFHDVVVKRIGGRQVMLLSYWDAGYVKLDVTDPRHAVYLGDTDFTFPDPELLAQTDRREDPEGNAHQAEFTRDNKYFIGADEDFAPTGLEGSTNDGAAFDAVPGSDTPQLTDGQTLTGTTVYAGRACDVDPAVPPAPTTGGPYIAVVTRGLCTFTEKVANVEAAGGYAGVVVVNREGSDGCSLFGMSVEGNIPAFSVDRRTGFGFFDLTTYDEAACRAGTASEIPGVTLGTTGDVITLRAFFDGWGYVHLFANENGKISELDTYAIGEAMDPRFATGFGDLSVHEVATSQRRSDLAYLSYYAGGFRVIKIANNQIQEVGRFIDKGGNNFWGVQVFRRGGVEYVAASDRDFGLYIFRYTGRR
jgi:PA domain